MVESAEAVAMRMGASERPITMGTFQVPSVPSLGSSLPQATVILTAPLPLNVIYLAINPATVQGGSSSTAFVSLSRPVPSGGTVVTLSSSNISVATVPASVTVSAGQTSATFTVSAKSVNTNTTINISAIYCGTTKTAALTVTKR